MGLLSQTLWVLLRTLLFLLSELGALGGIEPRSDISDLNFATPTPATVLEMGQSPGDWRAWGLHIDL